MYEVQKNVPVPPAIRAAAQRKYPLDTMDVGDSFFVPNKTRNTIAPHISNAGKKLGRQFSTRLCYMRKVKKSWKPCEPDDDGAVSGIGVWRDA